MAKKSTSAATKTSTVAPVVKAAAPAKSVKKNATPAKSASPPPSASKPTVVTLKQLGVQLGESHDLPAKEAQAMLDGVVTLIVEHLKAGDKLRLNGLGILEVKDRPARTGRNPATGETVQIAASKKIAFRAAKELKDAI